MDTLGTENNWRNNERKEKEKKRRAKEARKLFWKCNSEMGILFSGFHYIFFPAFSLPLSRFLSLLV
jgi:hypothetical protein